MSSSPIATVKLRKPLERALSEGHPWVWSDALEKTAPAGTLVHVIDARDRFVAVGIADDAPIGVRVFSTQREPVDAGLFDRRIRQALQLRQLVVPAHTTAYRLLHGEGDRLPGFVCDIYGQIAVAGLDGAGARAWQQTFIDAITPHLRARNVNTLLVRSGKRGAKQLDVAFGTSPSDLVDVLEHGMTLPADLISGQKTGLFLDHRESRRRVRELASQKRVLNLYGYTGGFSIAAALGGASHVTTVDIAPRAIELSNLGFEKNGIASGLHRGVTADVPEFLTQALKQGERYDLIVSDPPSFAPSEDAVDGAMRSYRMLHEASVKLLSPGGLYLAASCSSHIDRARFEATLRTAQLRRGAVMQILERWGGAADHPRLAAFPEGDYLKVTLCRELP